MTIASRSWARRRNFGPPPRPDRAGLDSTACSSSARAFISGQRLLAVGLVDAVLVGGAGSLCGLTLNGFDSLESLSCARCQPFDEVRQGSTSARGPHCSC